MVTEAKLEATQFEYQVPNDVYFYIPDDFKKADQPPTDMIAIHQGAMDAGLRFPLHPAILHLLVAWDLAQLTPNEWSYILMNMVLLGQAGLYRQPTPGEMNYLWSLVVQKGHYAVKNMSGRRLVHGIANKVKN